MAWHNMGVAYWSLEKHEKAIECYKKSLEDENYATPGNAWNDMGVAYYYLEKYEKAIDCYKKAIHYDSKDANAYSNLGEALYKLKRPANAYSNLGEALYKLKRPVDAEGQFRKAIRIKPKLAEPHYNLGITLTDEEFYEDAKNEYEIALKSEPKNADYLNSLGYVLVKLGKYAKAKENFEEAISSDPAHVKAHRNLMLLKKMSEMKYKLPTLLQYGLIAAIILVIISAYCLFCYNKLSGTEFVALIVFFISLLTAIILFQESRYFKVGPSGIEFSRDTEGKPMKPKSAELMPSHES
jgi:tetratricopeptide (TPR) repeat protein